MQLHHFQIKLFEGENLTLILINKLTDYINIRAYFFCCLYIREPLLLIFICPVVQKTNNRQYNCVILRLYILKQKENLSLVLGNKDCEFQETGDVNVFSLVLYRPSAVTVGACLVPVSMVQTSMESPQSLVKEYPCWMMLKVYLRVPRQSLKPCIIQSDD